MLAGATIATASTASAAPGSISGTITRGTGGAIASGHASATALDGGVSFQATSDAMGRYTLEVGPGTYCVSFSTGGNDVTSTSYVNARHCIAGATSVVVASGANVLGIDGVLHLGSVSGTISRAGGAPAVGATANAYQVGGSGHGYASAGPGGAYTIRNLPPGTYCFSGQDDSASTVGGLPGCAAGGRRIEVLADSDVAGVDLVLEPKPRVGSISGKLTFGGAPVANRAVEALETEGYAGSARTAADGTFTIQGLEPGSYCVRADIQPGSPGAAEAYNNADSCVTSTPVLVGTSTVPGVDLALDQGGTIRGTITSASPTPLAVANVGLQSFGVGPALSWSAQVRSAPGGAYELTGLPAGDYCLLFEDAAGQHAAEYFPDAASCEAGAHPVHVTRGATTVVDAQLGDGGTITGKVTVPAGQSVTDVMVSAVGAAMQTSPVQADATGNYTLKYVTPGSYCVSFRPLPPSDLVATAINSTGPRCTNGSGTLAVANGAIARGDVTLQLGGSVSGWVVTSSGLPIANPTVRVVPLAPIPDVYEVGYRTAAHPDGSFFVRGVPAGRYCVYYTSYEHGVGSTALGNVGSCSAPDLVPVTVAGGQHIGDLLIRPDAVGYITGTIRAVDGRALSGARVELFTPGSTLPIATYEANDGELELLRDAGPEPARTESTSLTYFGEVPAGAYCVKVTPPAGSGLLPRAYPAAAECGQGSSPVTVKATEYTTGIDITLALAPVVPGGPGTPGSVGSGVYVPLAEPGTPARPATVTSRTPSAATAPSPAPAPSTVANPTRVSNTRRGSANGTYTRDPTEPGVPGPPGTTGASASVTSIPVVYSVAFTVTGDEPWPHSAAAG